MTYTVAILIY